MNQCVDPCCKIFCFGQFDNSETIEIPLNVDVEGIYTLRVIDKTGQIYYVTASQELDATTMSFPNPFNEDMDLEFTIIDPDGNQIDYTVDDVTYCKFKIQNRIATNITPEVIEVTEFESDC